MSAPVSEAAVALLFQRAALAELLSRLLPAPLIVTLPVTPVSPFRSSMPEVAGVNETPVPAAVAACESVKAVAESTLTI